MKESFQMMRFVRGGLGAAVLVLGMAGIAHAWHVDGRVFCESTGLPLAGIRVDVISTGCEFAGSAITDSDGFYTIPLLEARCCYQAMLNLGPGERVVSPISGQHEFCTTETDFDIRRDWVVASPGCGESRCWLTGGGSKPSASGPQTNWGGNVNPGCNPESGEGGQWNHLDHDRGLRFQGRAIEVVRCGNVAGIPPGSTSPATPFNYIEFRGSGTLKGIKGNKANYGTVYFFAHCEDRNEPGSRGMRDGDGKDRYFLHVFANPANPSGSTLLLVDVDGNPATVDPITIGTGNLQIHVSSCDTPRASSTSASHASGTASSATPAAAASAEAGNLWLASGPNPAGERSTVRFGLEHEADVSLVVYDVTGRALRQLVDTRLSAGTHLTIWNLNDRSGVRVEPGIYFLRLTVAGTSRVQPLAVVR
jgi:hypothetical protein